MPANVSIGAENVGGTIGTTHHYNGEGAAVTTGDYLQVLSSAAGQVKIDYTWRQVEDFDLRLYGQLNYS